MATNRQIGKSIDDDIDHLFRLPLAEFIAARKALAARLKKQGRAAESDRVKSLPKPPLSVWVVNQLYWEHQAEFEKLIAAGQRFRRAHTSRTAKPEGLNEALDARREALNQLSDLATALLRDAGHNPGLDTLRRVATTLEAMSAYAVLPEDQAAGRLTKDLDPPGFESLAPFIRAVATARRPDEAPRASSSLMPAATSTRPSSVTKREAHVDESRQTKLANARATVQNAKKSLAEAQAKAQSLRKAQKKADGEVKIAEKQKRDAELRFKDASAASAAAAVRAQNIGRELAKVIKTVDDEEGALKQAAKELAILSRELR